MENKRKGPFTLKTKTGKRRRTTTDFLKMAPQTNPRGRRWLFTIPRGEAAVEEKLKE
jgi:hypothetical protein